MDNFKTNYTGNEYGYLTAIKFKESGGKGIGSIWTLQCACGNQVDRPITQVTAGRIRTCGKCELKYKLRTKSSTSTIRKNRKLGQLYQRYIRKATKERTEWKLTYEEFERKIRTNCVLCNAQPSTTMRGGTIQYNPVMRVDVKFGYTSENCAAVCKTCFPRTGKDGISKIIEWVFHTHKLLMKNS